MVHETVLGHFLLSGALKSLTMVAFQMQYTERLLAWVACRVRIGPAPHSVSRPLRAQNPRRVRKDRESAPGVSKEFEKSLKVRF